MPKQINIARLSINHLTFYWGLFPWLLILWVGISVGYFAWVQTKAGKLSTPLQALFKSNQPDDAIILAADFTARGAISFSLVSSLAIINLLFLIFLLRLFDIPVISNLRFSTLMLVTIFLVLPHTRYWQKSLRFLIRKKIPYSLMMILYIAAMTVLLLLAHILSSALAGNFPGWNEMRETLPALNWQQIWLLFSGMWWLSWISLMSGLMVYLSQGYSIRKIILGSLTVILLLQGVLFSVMQPLFQNSNWLPLILPLLGFFLLLAFFFRQEYFIYEIRGTVPMTAFEKPRSLFMPLQKLLQNATVFTVFYLLAGIFLPALLSVIVILPFVLLSIMALVVLLRTQ